MIMYLVVFEMLIKILICFDKNVRDVIVYLICLYVLIYLYFIVIQCYNFNVIGKVVVVYKGFYFVKIIVFFGEDLSLVFEIFKYGCFFI